MLDWTDRHCRHLHRLISRQARLYTEMVNTGAVLHGDRARHLDFDAFEHPVALQLGGSEPAELAAAARIGADRGYDEINLNCGCPSERVQKGAFGACLMAEPALVRDGVRAMRDAVKGRVPITVKHRIGIDREERYGFVRDFVGTVAEGGCEVFIVHARNAWLQGLSPKENREIPPLRHDLVARLKRDFPQLTIAINGGLRDLAQIREQLALVDGVMVGREAYHNPASLRGWDALCAPQQAAVHADAAAPKPDDDLAWREDIESRMVSYLSQQVALGVPWPHMARHMLGLYNGLPGARRWRQVWSDHRLKLEPPQRVAVLARAARLGPSAAQERAAARDERNAAAEGI